jgi:hypothetical protein
LLILFTLRSTVEVLQEDRLDINLESIIIIKNKRKVKNCED